MSTKVRETLINVKDGNNNAYDHFKKLIVKMAMEQEGIDGLEKKSFGLKKEQPKENVFQVKESFAHLKEYESKNKALLGVKFLLFCRNWQQGRKNPKNQDH